MLKTHYRNKRKLVSAQLTLKTSQHIGTFNFTHTMFFCFF